MMNLTHSIQRSKYTIRTYSKANSAKTLSATHLRLDQLKKIENERDAMKVEQAQVQRQLSEAETVKPLNPTKIRYLKGVKSKIASAIKVLELRLQDTELERKPFPTYTPLIPQQHHAEFREFVDPLDYQIMMDPYRMPNGRVFDLSTLLTLSRDGTEKIVCPFSATYSECDLKDCHSDTDLKNRIQRWIEEFRTKE